MKKIKKTAFTLVELIITITILAILGTIGFVSYSGYLGGVRDTNRISNLKSISDSLALHKTKYTLPLPDDYIEVKANGEIIAYQGYVSKSTIGAIEFSNEGLDPKDNTYYSYYLTKDRKYYQLMGFLEEENNLEIAGILNNVNAIDYTTRYPVVYGKKLGILTDINNTPIQELSNIKTAGKIELDTTNSGTIYIAHIKNGKTYTFTGNILNHKLYTLSKPGVYGPPKDCAEGFIGVWGDSAFSQKGFCVAKYEMSFAGLTQTDGTGDRNTYSYLDNGDQGIVVSAQGNSPIAEITQAEAIAECSAMGKGYHLITNNEWMAISRNIELEDINWSNGVVGDGFIYNGISSDLTMGCSGTGSTYLPTSTAYATVTGADVCNGKNKLTLSNGQEIWDLSGNVWEHVNKANTVDGTDYNLLQTTIAGSSNLIGWDDDGIYTTTEMDKYGSILHLGTTNGMGNLYYANGIDSNIFLRGAAANAASSAGVFTLRLSWTSATQYRTTGFRCTK